MSKFVIHENNSEQKYWILRLEIEEILKSWMLPKNPFIEELRERIAIQIKERGKEYLEYEGALSEKDYGYGEAKIMDSGELEIISNEENKIEFKLEGEKFKGEYYLKKIDYGINPEHNWLLFKVEEKKLDEKLEEEKEINEED